MSKRHGLARTAAAAEEEGTVYQNVSFASSSSGPVSLPSSLPSSGSSMFYRDDPVVYENCVVKIGSREEINAVLIHRII